MSLKEKPIVPEAVDDMCAKQTNGKLQDLKRFSDSLQEIYSDLNKQLKDLINDWSKSTNTAEVIRKRSCGLYDILDKMIDFCEDMKMEVGRTEATKPVVRVSTLFTDFRSNRDSGISANEGSERNSKVPDLQDSDELYTMNVSNVKGRRTITFTSSRAFPRGLQSCDTTIGPITTFGACESWERTIMGTRLSARRGSAVLNNLSRTAEERSISSDEENSRLSPYGGSCSELSDMIRRVSITSSDVLRTPSTVSACTQTETS